MKLRRRHALLVVASALALTSARVTSQTKPLLDDYYKALPLSVLDAGYLPRTLGTWWIVDLNGDGNQDLVVIGGAGGPQDGVTADTFAPQPGRVYFGDGDGNFTRAPADLFPVDTLKTVACREVLFADFNADGRPDMFIPCTGWDAQPFPGEQNQLYLSRPGGGWRDATATLPQISDFTHSATVGDISGRGLIDIFVGNGYASSSLNGPYTLLNTGSGQFTQTTTNIPVGKSQLLAPLTGHSFPGATLTDLNDDGLPELIVTSDNAANFRRTTILWNRAGAFSESDKTELPLPAPFTQHIDLNVERIDANLDGLQDLVIVGTQGGAASYNGSFLQLLINKGNRQFVDETAGRIPPGESSRGIDGVRVSTAPYAKWVHVVDFNHDGAPDISMEFGGGGYTRDQPFIWLNDGTGHFTVLKIGDFVAAGMEYTIAGEARLVPTRNGYSFIKIYPSSNGLMIRPLLATRPYRVPGKNVVPTPAAPLTVRIVGTAGSGAFTPNPSPAATGDRIVFTNSDSQTHHLMLDGAVSAEIGTLAPGQTSTPITLTSAGATYHCTIHPSMVGSIGTVSTPPVPPTPPPDDYYSNYRQRQRR